jgi:hypothetical protein
VEQQKSSSSSPTSILDYQQPESKRRALPQLPAFSYSVLAGLSIACGLTFWAMWRLSSYVTFRINGVDRLFTLVVILRCIQLGTMFVAALAFLSAAQRVKPLRMVLAFLLAVFALVCLIYSPCPNLDHP